ncbi:MAG: Hsp20/alpha crystallin family protein [Syntrophobacterales bacterium]|jgi:HSP20 family protein
MLIKSGSVKGELERMRREMDRIWDRFSQEPSTYEQHWNPSLDLMETEASLVAEVEVPGINPDDIDISVTSDMLTVTGEKKREPGVQGKNYHFMERAYGRFSRSIPLPTAVNPDRVEARYKDGILTIAMGKSGAAKSKRIEVKTA